MGNSNKMRGKNDCTLTWEQFVYDELGMGPATPIAALTLRQFLQMQGIVHESTATMADNTESTRYIYGLRGIMQLFGVSHKTAQAWKNTFLAPACSQVGRTIIVNRDKAIELFEATGRAAMDSYGL